MQIKLKKHVVSVHIINSSKKLIIFFQYMKTIIKFSREVAHIKE